jgi:hypothetical protein
MHECTCLRALGVAAWLAALPLMPVAEIGRGRMTYLSQDFFANGCPPSDPPTIMFVPSERILCEAMTRFYLSLAYAAITPKISKRRLAAFVFDRFIEFDGIVIDNDGVEFDLLNPNMDVDAIFGGDDDPSWSWCGDFLSARIRVPQQNAAKKIAVRYKMLWIALAIYNPAAAQDILR